MSLTERFVKGASFSALASVTSRGFFFVNSIILARYLGTSNFGVFNTINSLINSLAILALFGLNITLTKFISEFMVKDKEKVGGFIVSAFLLCLLITVLIATIYFFISQKLAAKLYSDPSLSGLMRISAFSLLFLSLVSLGNGIVQGFQEFKLYAFTSIATSFLVIPVTLFFLWKWGLKGAIASLAFLFFLNCLFLAQAIRKISRSKGITLRTGFSLGHRSEIFQFALPVFLSGIVVAPASWMGNTFLASARGFNEVGIFNVANVLSQMVIFVPLVILTPILPIFSEVQAMGDYQRLSGIVSRNLKFIWLFTLPVVIGISSLSKVLILRVYGNQYSGSLIPAFFMLWTALLIVINNVVGTSIISDSRKIWHAFGLNLFWFLIYLPSVYLLSSWRGATGVAGAFAFSYVVFSIITYLYSVRKLQMGYPNLKGFLSLTLVSALAAFFLATQINGLKLWVLTFIWLALVSFIEWRFFLDSEERFKLLGFFKILKLLPK